MLSQRRKDEKILMELDKDYQHELQRALQTFQFIEETLKNCIHSFIEIAMLHDTAHFLRIGDTKNIDNLPLGRLVNAFRKFHDDKSLHSDLQKITKERNQVAHRSCLFTIGELDNVAHMAEATLNMKDIADHAHEVHNRVLDVRYELLKTLVKIRRSQEKLALGVGGRRRGQP